MHNTTIATIQSDFISIFAALDSWCDEPELGISNKTCDSEASKAFIAAVAINDDILSNRAVTLQLPESDPAHHDHDHAWIHLWDVRGLVPSAYHKAVVDTLESMNKHDLRRIIRQQLFTILCRLERVEEFEITVTTSGDEKAVSGIEGFRLMLHCMLSYIRRHEEMLADFHAWDN